MIKMGADSASKILGLTASVIIIIQGLTWICLTLMAMLVHLEAWEPELAATTYGEGLNSAIIGAYLKGNTTAESIILGPNEFFYCNMAQFILSGFWLIVASFELWAISQETAVALKYSYLTFGVSILIGCIYDVVLTSLFAIDYDTIVGKINSTGNWNTEETFLVLACGILMTIAARGFILWIVNFTFGVLLIKASLDISTKVIDDFNLINAFAAPEAPSTPIEATNPNTNLTNEMLEGFAGLPRLPPIQSTNDRLKKLNKVNKVSPLAMPSYYNKYANNKSSFASDSSSINSSIRKPRFQTASDTKNRNLQY